MQVSLATHYGLKAMLFLAKQEQESIVSVKRIAEEEGIPFKFLEQILRKLRASKLVSSTRGKEGGYTLGKPSASITVLDVYQSIEGQFSLFHGNDHVSWFWENIDTTLRDALSVTLEDMIFRSKTASQVYSI